MGLFGSVRALQRQARDLQGSSDLGTRLGGLRTAMDDATRLLEQQAATNAVAVDGEPAEATILAVRDTGTRLNGNPVLQLDLTISLPGAEPTATTTTAVVPLLALPHTVPGGQLGVRVGEAGALVHVERFGPA